MALDTAKEIAVMHGLRAAYDRRAIVTVPYYPQVCSVVPSSAKYETYANLGDAPGVEEWLGDRNFGKFRAGTYQVANRLWAAGVEVEKTDIDDDQLGMYPLGFEQLAQNTIEHPDELLYNECIIAGDSSECWDGQNFYDTDHEWGDSGTQSNKLTYNVADPDAPTVAELKAAYNYGRTTMEKYKTDTGRLLNRDVGDDSKDLIVMCPSLMHQNFATALGASIIDSTSNIVINVPRIKKTARLTDERSFYIHNVGGVLRPFMFQAREPISKGFEGMGDITKKSVKFGTKARYNIGFGPWWTSVKITLT